MSLVNDMLRDLEQRNENRPTPVTGDSADVKSVRYNKPKTLSGHILLWLFCVILLGVIGWLVWHNNSPQPLVTALSPEATNKLDPIPETSAVQPISVQTVRWAGTYNGGDLVTRLNANTDVRIISQNESSVEVAFEKTLLQTPMPSLTGTPIKSLDFKVEETRALLTLTTIMPVKFMVRIQQNPTVLIISIIPKLSPLTQLPQQPEQTSIPIEDKPLVIETDQQVTVEYQPAESSTTGTGNLTKTSRQKISAVILYRQARKLVSQGKYAAAIAVLKKQLKQYPTQSNKARALLVTTLLATGQTKQAQLLLTESLIAYPAAQSLKRLQARIWIQQQQYQQAVKLLQSSPPALSKDYEYHELLATALQQTGMPTEAATIYYQLLQLNNRQPRWWIAMATALEQSNRYAEAQTAYRTGLKILSISPQLKRYAQQRIRVLASK